MSSRGRRRRNSRHRDHYTAMSDCDGAENATSTPPVSWRCRGNGHQDATNIYRDRRLCSNFDVVVGPSPPSYTVSMQHYYNCIWNDSPGSRGANASNSVRMMESNHSHVNNVSMLCELSRAEANEETRLEDVEEEREDKKESSSPPPLYDNIVTTNRMDTAGD